jgi:hypothetical protein
MLQSGHWSADSRLTDSELPLLLGEAIDSLDIESARSEVQRFLTDPAAVEVWSREFFRSVTDRIIFSP